MRNKKKKIGLIGYLGYATSTPIIGGQMSKTRGIIKQLEQEYPGQIMSVDTSNWKKEVFSLILQCFEVANQCDVVIVMPIKNGIKFVLPFFALLKGIKRYKMAYPIVGGWLTGLLKKHRYLAWAFKRVDYLLPETKQLMEELKKFTDAPIDVMSIFSTRKPLKLESLDFDAQIPFKFCTFSRVTLTTGIDDAIEAIANVNQSVDGLLCKLDVWGPIEEKYSDHYKKIFEKNKEFATYKGLITSDEGLEKLSEYYMMLFPTYYPGEGFPTAICESFMAGLPVIASDWRFNNELVENKETSFLIPVHVVDGIARCIDYAINHREDINKMKTKCLMISEQFKPVEVMRNLDFWIRKEHNFGK